MERILNRWNNENDVVVVRENNSFWISWNFQLTMFGRVIVVWYSWILDKLIDFQYEFVSFVEIWLSSLEWWRWIKLKFITTNLKKSKSTSRRFVFIRRYRGIMMTRWHLCLINRYSLDKKKKEFYLENETEQDGLDYLIWKVIRPILINWQSCRVMIDEIRQVS